MTAVIRAEPSFPVLSNPLHTELLTHVLVTVPHAALRPAGVVRRSEEQADDLTRLALSIHHNTEYALDGSVRLSGVLTPLVARPGAFGQPGDIAVGERRWRAVQLLMGGFHYEIEGESRFFQVPDNYPLPVQFREMDDAEMVACAAVDSIHASPLNELDQSDLCAELHRAGFSYDQIARKLSLSFATVERRVTLGYHLGREGRDLLRSGVLTMKGARLLCSTSGPLRSCLIQAARSGMSTKDLEVLLERGSVQVSHARFDVARSGLAVTSRLFDDGQPEVFVDGKAAMARQLASVQAEAQDLQTQTGQWVDVRAVDGDPTLLPQEYHAGACAPDAGCLFVYSASTGQVHLHRGVGRGAAPAAPKQAVRSSPLPHAPGNEHSRQSGVKDWVVTDAETYRVAALADALMDHPHAGLANVAVQLLQLGGQIQVTGMTSPQKRSSEAVRVYAAWAAAQYPALFVSYSPGLLQLRREVSAAQAFQSLLTWEGQDLARLITFFSLPSAFDGGSPYQQAVAEQVGADALLLERYELNAERLEGHTRKGLEALIASMPEAVRPIVMPGAESKPQLKELIIGRLRALRAARWLPPYVRL